MSILRIWLATTRISSDWVVSTLDCWVAKCRRTSHTHFLRVATRLKIDLRTGDFTQISENYLVREPDQPTIYTADSFETEMYQLIHTMGNLVSKMVFFFQGILAGLTLLQILTLRLSPTNFSEQIGRIDQCIRIACFVSTFGSFYLLVSNRRTCKSNIDVDNSLTIKATATELN